MVSSSTSDVTTRATWMFSWRPRARRGYFRGGHARNVDVFVEDEDVCVATWAVHACKIRVRGLAISRPSWDF